MKCYLIFPFFESWKHPHPVCLPFNAWPYRRYVLRLACSCSASALGHSGFECSKNKMCEQPSITSSSAGFAVSSKHSQWSNQHRWCHLLAALLFDAAQVARTKTIGGLGSCYPLS